MIKNVKASFSFAKIGIKSVFYRTFVWNMDFVMKKLSYFLLFLLVCVLGCKSKRVVVEPLSVQQTPLQVRQDSLSTSPVLSAPVVYMLAREYESIHDSTTLKYHTDVAALVRQDSITLPHYMEMRLSELYPACSYKGLMQKLGRTARKAIPKKRSRTVQLPSGTSDSFAILEDAAYHTSDYDAFHAFVSDEDEIQFLNMTDAERNVYCLMNSLADDSTFFTLSDIDTVIVRDSAWNLNKPLLSDSIPFFLQENLTIPFLFAGAGSYMLYRIMQSKARAEYVSNYYYPGQTKDGRRGDAYKHLLINVMLKRYTTEALAWLIMDVYWEKQGSNAPCDMVMDLHNNHVGRSRYQQFRGDFWRDRYDWLAWSENIRLFVEDTTRNATYQSWNKRLPLFFIQQEEEKTDPKLYLYWNKE